MIHWKYLIGGTPTNVVWYCSQILSSSPHAYRMPISIVDLRHFCTTEQWEQWVAHLAVWRGRTVGDYLFRNRQGHIYDLPNSLSDSAPLYQDHVMDGCGITSEVWCLRDTGDKHVYPSQRLNMTRLMVRDLPIVYDKWEKHKWRCGRIYKLHLGIFILP